MNDEGTYSSHELILTGSEEEGEDEPLGVNGISAAIEVSDSCCACQECCTPVETVAPDGSVAVLRHLELMLGVLRHELL